jgi:hypothetical protein
VRRGVYRGDVTLRKAIARLGKLLYPTARLRCSELGSTLCSGLKIPALACSTENAKCPLRREFIWTRRMLPAFLPIGLDWATFQVMRRTHASRSKEAGRGRSYPVGPDGQHRRCERK